MDQGALLKLLICVLITLSFSKSLADEDFFDVLRANNIDSSLVEDLPHKKIKVQILPFGTDLYKNNSQTFPASGPEEDCKIVVIHPSSTRAQMIHQDSTIPLKYIRTFSGPDYTFTRVLLHEATHCDMYSGEGSLEREILGDVFATKAIVKLKGGVQEALILKYKRAIRALLGEGVSHALALSLDALEHNQPLPKPSAVTKAHLAIYDLLYEAGILDPDVHGYRYEEEGDLIREVYRFMLRELEGGRFEHDTLMKRTAELYVEGLNFLAPDLGRLQPLGRFCTFHRN
jgi:hypothetical protein